MTRQLRETDRFLIGIVVGIILLVMVAFVVVASQPQITYLPDDTPQAVAQNYLLALQRQDYARAQGYLSPTIKNYPTSAETFARNIKGYSWTAHRMDDSTALSVEAVQVTNDYALVRVRERTFMNPGLFGSGDSGHNFNMQLQRENGAWKLISADEYWAYCWDYSGTCK